jgi:hypothetical protein
MGRLSLVSAISIALLAGAAALVLGRGLIRLARSRRPGAPPPSGLRSRVGFYLFFTGLFGLDFFLILRRDGWRASWSLTFWMMLAAFMIGEAIGRWNAHRVPAGSESPEA